MGRTNGRFAWISIGGGTRESWLENWEGGGHAAPGARDYLLRASWTIEMTIEMGRDRASRELLATNRVDLVGKLLRHVAHLGAKIGHGVAQRLHGRRVGVRVHLEHDSVIGRVRVLVAGEHHVRVFV